MSHQDSAPFSVVRDEKRALPKKQTIEVTTEPIPYIHQYPPPSIQVVNEEAVMKSAMTSMRHRTSWIDVGAMSSIAILVPTISPIGLQYYYVQCDDYLGNLTHYAKVSTDSSTGTETARIIVINSSNNPRRIIISWL